MRITGRRSVSRERGILRKPAGSHTSIEALLVEDSLLSALVAIKYLNPFCAVDHTSQRIRSIPGCELIPAVALTGYAKLADKERLFALGFTRYLAKPYIEEALVTLIESVLVKP